MNATATATIAPAGPQHMRALERANKVRLARAEHAGTVCLVDHQAGSEALAQLADVEQRRDVPLHREDTVDDDEHAAAVALRAVEHLLELVEAEHGPLPGPHQV